MQQQDNEVERIIHSTTSNDLMRQIKQCNSYQSRIEEELLKKTSQINQLQNYLRDQITNIHKIVEENNKLKKDIEIQAKIIAFKTSQNGNLASDLKRNLQMNEELRDIIKRLQDQVGQLQNQNEMKSPRQTRQQSIQTQPTKQQQNDKSFNQLINKVNTLQEQINHLKNQKACLQNRIHHYEQQSIYSQSTIKESYNEPIFIEQNRLKTDQILNLITEESLREVKFKGEIVDGLKEGQGICEYKDNVVYQGLFFKGKRHGLGQISAYDQLVYRGYWKNGIMEGKGLLKMLEGEIQSYEGQFHDGRLSGYGYMKLKSGKKITALWSNGKIVGNCLQVFGKSTKYRKPELIECY